MAEVYYGLRGNALARKNALMYEIESRGWECSNEQEEKINEILHEYITDEYTFEDALIVLRDVESLDKWIGFFDHPDHMFAGEWLY